MDLDAYIYLAKMITRLSSLISIKLNLSHTSFTGDCAVRVAEAISKNRNLRKVDLKAKE